MARVALEHLSTDERGAVYVEFLIVFMPVFLMFLGICQSALVSAASFVVQHAAGAAARAAVVVLEESPDDFGGVERGRISKGAASASDLSNLLLESLGFSGDLAPSTAEDASSDRPQQGARMAPIRFAAYVPLAVLAPLPEWLDAGGPGGTLGDAVSVSARARLGAAVLYNRAGAAITLQAKPASDDLASEPIARKAPVTVRVTYLYYCSIPIVRVLGCRTLQELIGSPPSLSASPSDTAQTPAQRRLTAALALVEDPKRLSEIEATGARFVAITAETTLPNQGAAYY